MHCSFADTAKGGEIRDLIRTSGKIGCVTPWLAPRPASEAEEFARRAFMSLSLLLFLYESLQLPAVNNDRAATVNRGEAVLEPMPHGVAVNAEELRDVRRVIGASLLDPVDGITSPPLGLPRL